MSQAKNVTERTLFINWAKNRCLLVLCFAISKLFRKIKANTFDSNLTYYPKKVLQLLALKNYDAHPVWSLPASQSIELLDPIDEKIEISLASRTIKTSGGKINWFQKFEDPEDEESLHRWNWILMLLSKERSCNKNLTAWVTRQIENWFDLFMPEIRSKEKTKRSLLRWQSYTAGERISNSIIFYYLTQAVPSGKIINGLKAMADFLISHLEYNGNLTGNHIINNARAVYFAGVALDKSNWREIGATIIKRESPILVTKDGFLREGSSHYQFLFTRWLLEINYFAQLNNDSDLVDYLRPLIDSLIRQCKFFMVYNEDENKWDMPKFGDISPDFQPEWLLDLPWSKLCEPFQQKTQDVNSHTNNSSWGRLFGLVESNRKYKVSQRNLNLQEFAESGWFRFDCGSQTLFLRFDSGSPAEYAGHHHNDMFHFCLFNKGIPVLVDSGRLNYISNDYRGCFGLRPEAHNTFLVDGVGIVPLQWRRYPLQYIQCENHLNIEPFEKNGVKITLRSDGLWRLLSPIKVSRVFRLSPTVFSIEDRFDGAEKHFIQTFFHWGAAVNLKHINDHEWTLEAKNSVGVFNISTDASYKLSGIRGGSEPHGWIVNQYGSMEESNVFRINALNQLPLTSTYSICWENN